MKKLISWLKRALGAAWEVIKDFFHNLDGVIITILAIIGLHKLLTMVPYTIALPLWVEMPMVGTTIACLLVIMLAFLPLRKELIPTTK